MKRDPFANDVLERLARSNQDYQRAHGHYIVPLAERLIEARHQRDELLARLQADPDRAAIATIDGLKKILADDTEAAGRVLDWIGVAADLSLSDRVKWLAVQLATTQGYSLDEAERLADAALSGSQQEQS